MHHVFYLKWKEFFLNSVEKQHQTIKHSTHINILHSVTKYSFFANKQQGTETMFHINRYVKKDISNSNFFKKGLQGLYWTDMMLNMILLRICKNNSIFHWFQFDMGYWICGWILFKWVDSCRDMKNVLN